MMLKRYALPSLLGTGVTVVLFFTMQSLIAMGEGKLLNEMPSAAIEFVRLKSEGETRVKKRELPKKQPEKEPPPPQMNMALGAAENAADDVFVPAPSFDTSVDLAGGLALGAAPADTEVVPVVRVQPMYPRSAAERKIEGWVRMRFSINKLGGVENAKVVAAEPARVFDRAALRALRKWKYKPKVVNGTPVDQHGIEVQLTFKLGA